MINIKSKLDRLAGLYAQLESQQEEKKRLIREAFPPEVAARLAEIDEEFAQKEEYGRQSIDALETEIRADTLALGSTVRSGGLQAVWSMGRVVWDDKALCAYARSRPEVLQFRTEGKPVISIRRQTERSGGTA